MTILIRSSAGINFRNFLTTAATLALPTGRAVITPPDAQGNPSPDYMAIGPMVGATNQRLAGLTFVLVTVG